MALPIDKKGILQLQVWHCDPSRERVEGVSGVTFGGCGYVMLQGDSEMGITECPACHEVYSFVETDYMAEIKVREA